MDAQPKQCPHRAGAAGRQAISLADSNLLPIIIGLLVIFFTLLILLILKRRRVAKNDILVTGLCESGKTLTWTQFILSEDRETYTSVKENLGGIQMQKGNFRLVDIPGHERLRNKFFDQYKASARVIVYVIDSVTFQKDIRDVADFLYTILSDNAVSSTPLVIACNKQDQTLAKGSTVIQNLLEKELNLVRQTRTSQLQSVDNSASNAVFLGRQGKDFEFSQLNQPVEFVECSAKSRDLEGLQNIIKKFV